MKYLIFIFAVYFASLTAMPCQDALASQGACASEEVGGHEKEEQHSGEDEASEDLCSPFCSCHCCQIHKVGIAASENISLPLQRESKESITPILLSKELFSIWHPPKA